MTLKVKLVVPNAARQRDKRVAELEAQVRELESTIACLEAQEKSEPAPAPAPAPVAAGPADLDAVRAALLQVAAGKAPKVEDLALAPQDASLYSLVAALMEFTLNYGMSRNFILAELGVGAVAMADSVMIERMQDKVQKSMRACLEGDPSASETLHGELKEYAKFLIGLQESFQHSINEGSRGLLDALSQAGMADRHKRAIVGVDYEAAWNELEGIHARLSDLSRVELWEQFFLEPFRSKLGVEG